MPHFQLLSNGGQNRFYSKNANKCKKRVTAIYKTSLYSYCNGTEILIGHQPSLCTWCRTSSSSLTAARIDFIKTQLQSRRMRWSASHDFHFWPTLHFLQIVLVWKLSRAEKSGNKKARKRKSSDFMPRASIQRSATGRCETTRTREFAHVSWNSMDFHC